MKQPTGFNKVLDNLSFTVKSNEKIALIGSNGCGKSTILKMILQGKGNKKFVCICVHSC